MIRAIVLALVLLVPSLTFAHHGGGTFDNTRTVELTGTLTRLDLINPHSWIYFEVTDKNGTAEDPVYFTGQYAGSDVLQPADLPYSPDTCSEQGFVDCSKQK